MSLASSVAIAVVTASSFFVLGAYYQHYDVLKKIQQLERRNVHAFFIRRKLYDLLGLFYADPNNTIAAFDSNEEGADTHKLGSIMKYGFPSMNEIRLNKNYVTSFDRRNSGIHWMCEHLQCSVSKMDITELDNSNNNNNNQVDNNNQQRAARFVLGGAEKRSIEDVSPIAATTTDLPQKQQHKSQTHPNNSRISITDEKFSESSRVFFMSNIKPFLNKGFNLNVWTKLQHYIDELIARYSSVYVYTGSIYLPKENEKQNWYLEFQPENEQMVAVPTHFFKIIIIDGDKEISTTPYAEAFVIPNAPLRDNLDIRTMLSDVRDIENATGLQFFEGLERHFVKTQVSSSLSHHDYAG